MNCTRFDRWLDEGMPAAVAARALTHAATCSRCEQAQRTALEVEALLALEPVPAPPALRDAVLTRIAAGQRFGAAEVKSRALQPDPLPWWVRAAAEPRVAVGLAAAVVLYRGVGEVASLVANAGSVFGTSLGSLTPQFPPLVNPVSWFGLACAAVPVSLLGSMALYRGADAWIQRAALGSRILDRE